MNKTSALLLSWLIVFAGACSDAESESPKADGGTLPDADAGDVGSPDADTPDADAGGDVGSPDADNPEADTPDAVTSDADTPDAEDGDTTADVVDTDSDGDTISDADEGTGDPDGDLTPSYLDDDSDGDTISDADEAGDDDLATPPRDSDSDGISDFLDEDSDNDGLTDLVEVTETSTNPCESDSDGDGVSDLVEYAAGTDPNGAGDSPLANGDFVFAVPYQESALPTSDTLSHSTDPFDLDVYFLVDSTASMGGEIANLQSNLTGTIAPGIEAEYPSSQVWYGAGAFADYPYGGYGSTGDVAFRHLQDMTASIAVAQAAINGLTANGGGDTPESHVPALHALATGCGDGGGMYAVASDPGGACSNPSLVGYPHFRSEALPVVVLITDAVFHNGPSGNNYGAMPGVTPPSYAQTVTALSGIHARVIGINSGDAQSRTDLTALANATGSIGPGGPLVYDIAGDGTGLAARVLDGIAALAPTGVDISAVMVDDPTDSVDAVAAFVDHVVPNVSGAGACASGLSITDDDGDGTEDTFLDVSAGTTVCFDILPQSNTSVAATSEPQLFNAVVQIWLDKVTLVDERNVYFVVPAH